MSEAQSTALLTEIDQLQRRNCTKARSSLWFSKELYGALEDASHHGAVLTVVARNAQLNRDQRRQTPA